MAYAKYKDMAPLVGAGGGAKGDFSGLMKGSFRGEFHDVMRSPIKPSSERVLRPSLGQSRPPLVKGALGLGGRWMRDLIEDIAAELEFETQFSEWLQLQPGPDPSTWVVPGFTLVCQMPPGACDGQQWLSGYVGYPIFPCGSPVYECNNFGLPNYTQAWSDLGAQSQVSVLKAIGFASSVTHIWESPAPVNPVPDPVGATVPLEAPLPVVDTTPLEAPAPRPSPKWDVDGRRKTATYILRALQWVVEEEPGGEAGGAGASGDWAVEPQARPQKLPDPKRHPEPGRARVTRYRRTQTAPVRVPPRYPPPAVVEHKEVPDKAMKVRKVPLAMMQALRMLHTLTEVRDFVEALIGAIPGGAIATAGMGLAEQLVYVLNNWRQIDLRTAVHNLVANEVEDQVIGRVLSLGQVRAGQWVRPFNDNYTVTAYLGAAMSGF